MREAARGRDWDIKQKFLQPSVHARNFRYNRVTVATKDTGAEAATSAATDYAFLLVHITRGFYMPYTFGSLNLLTAIALLFLALAPGARGQDLGPLDKALNAAGYRLYNPPRENWGPGFVFSGDVANGKITNVREICPNLYADLEAPRSVAVILPDYDANDSFSFGVAVNFLKGLLGLNVDVDKVQRERSISVKWKNLSETSYADIDKWLESGEPRPIAKLCRLAIEDLKARKQFDDRIFVMVRAVAPKRSSLTFRKPYRLTPARQWRLGSKVRQEPKERWKLRIKLSLKQKGSCSSVTRLSSN